MCHMLQVLEALSADAQLPLPLQLQPRHACLSNSQAPRSLCSPAQLGTAAPQSSQHTQNQGAQTGDLSQVPMTYFPQHGRSFAQEELHQKAQASPSLPVASAPQHRAVSAPAQELAAVSLSEHRPQQKAHLSTALDAVLPSPPQHSMAPHQAAQELAAGQRHDTQQTGPPALCAHLLCSPSLRFQPSPQQPVAAQSGMLQPFPGNAAQMGILRAGGSPQQRPAHPGQAGQMGVLQSGSSEELARALADLTQMVSCARSDHAQGASPGAARPAQPAQLNALLMSVHTEQQLPGQQQAAPDQQHVPHPQVHAEQQASQHREPGPRLELDDIVRPSGPQLHAAVQPRASATQRQGIQQPAKPVVVQQQHSVHDHEGKRKRDSSQVCAMPQHPGQPSAAVEDEALPAKRAKLCGRPSQMDDTVNQMPPLQTQTGPHVAHGAPAGINHGVRLPPAAQARSLHATLRCAPNITPHVTALRRSSTQA